jgi:hypothetical protein
LKALLKFLFSSKAAVWVVRGVGAALAISFLVVQKDFRFSPIWVVGYLAIFLFVSGLAVLSGIEAAFPILRSHLIPLSSTSLRPTTEAEWIRAMRDWLLEGSGGGWLLGFFTVAEDGVVCVPLIFIGITPLTALAAGIAFGFMHLGISSYLQCIARAVAYSTACFFVLPHGFLTLATGHLLGDYLALLFFLFASRGSSIEK